MFTKPVDSTSRRIPSATRRLQILETATGLFSRMGYQRTTLKLLAAECGITEPALYRYFKSKDDLYRSVLTALQERLEVDDLFRRLERTSDIEELLFGIARFIVTTYSENTELSRLLYFSLLEGHPEGETVFRSLRLIYIEFLSQRLAVLSKAGNIQPVQPDITARCFVGMVMDCALGMHLWQNLQGRRYDAERVIRNNVPIYVRGLRLEPGPDLK